MAIQLNRSESFMLFMGLSLFVEGNMKFIDCIMVRIRIMTSRDEQRHLVSSSAPQQSPIHPRLLTGR